MGNICKIKGMGYGIVRNEVSNGDEGNGKSVDRVG